MTLKKRMAASESPSKNRSLPKRSLTSNQTMREKLNLADNRVCFEKCNLRKFVTESEMSLRENLSENLKVFSPRNPGLSGAESMLKYACERCNRGPRFTGSHPKDPCSVACCVKPGVLRTYYCQDSRYII